MTFTSCSCLSIFGQALGGQGQLPRFIPAPDINISCLCLGENRVPLNRLRSPLHPSTLPVGVAPERQPSPAPPKSAVQIKRLPQCPAASLSQQGLSPLSAFGRPILKGHLLLGFPLQGHFSLLLLNPSPHLQHAIWK